MWWTYPFKVNKALAAMGNPPNVFEGEWRSGMQQIGKAGGLSPEETALIIVSHGLGVGYPDGVEMAIGIWQSDGKIDISKPELKDAFYKMGFNV